MPADLPSQESSPSSPVFAIGLMSGTFPGAPRPLSGGVLVKP
jgi:hypothetical protein